MLATVTHILTSVLALAGLEINTTKSFTFSWLVDGKSKHVIFNGMVVFSVVGQPLRALSITDQFLYLEMNVLHDGRTFKSTRIADDLAILKKSSLKPQQKLFLLHTMLMPQYYHRFVLGNVFIGHLKKLDLKVRMFLRNLLHLPHNAAFSAFYVPVQYEGMGLSCLRWTVSMMA